MSEILHLFFVFFLQVGERGGGGGITIILLV